MTGADLTPQLTPRQHQVRVAALSVLTKLIGEAATEARRAAEPVFADARNGDDGASQYKPKLAGVELGTITVKKGKTRLDLGEGEAALTAWADQHPDEAYRDEVNDHTLAERPDVVALIKEHFPELVHRVIRPEWRERQIKAALADKQPGRVFDSNGEFTVIGTVTTDLATGEFAFLPSADARGLIMATLHDGTLAAATGTVFDGLLALDEAPVDAELVDEDPPEDDGLTAAERDTINGLADLLGHADPGRGCTGWQYDPVTREVTCACGVVLNPSNDGWAGPERGAA